MFGTEVCHYQKNQSPSTVVGIIVLDWQLNTLRFVLLYARLVSVRIYLNLSVLLQNMTPYFHHRQVRFSKHSLAEVPEFAEIKVE